LLIEIKREDWNGNGVTEWKFMNKQLTEYDSIMSERSARTLKEREKEQRQLLKKLEQSKNKKKTATDNQGDSTESESAGSIEEIGVKADDLEEKTRKLAGEISGLKEEMWRMQQREPYERNRTIEVIETGDPVWSYRGGRACIEVNYSAICRIATKVCRGRDGRYETQWSVNPVSVYLYHELLHWFHDIRFPVRLRAETDVQAGEISGSELVWYYYTGNDHGYIDGFNRQGNPWCGNEYGQTEAGRDLVFKAEEMRTIVGVNNITESIPGKGRYGSGGKEWETQRHFYNGDELSENLYSYFQKPGGAGMRYGHALRIIGGQHHEQIELALRVVRETAEKIEIRTARKIDIQAEVQSKLTEKACKDKWDEFMKEKSKIRVDQGKEIEVQNGVLCEAMMRFSALDQKDLESLLVKSGSSTEAEQPSAPEMEALNWLSVLKSNDKIAAKGIATTVISTRELPQVTVPLVSFDPFVQVTSGN
jgi:hypothetical protein